MSSKLRSDNFFNPVIFMVTHPHLTLVTNNTRVVVDFAYNAIRFWSNKLIRTTMEPDTRAADDTWALDTVLCLIPNNKDRCNLTRFRISARLTGTEL